jgi:DNA-binding MarR family transcriptional regulator
VKIEKVIKQGTRFKSSHEKAAVNLIYTSSWFRDTQNTLFKDHSILPQHYNVLRILKGKHPESVSPGIIKEVMLEKNNDITRLLDKLVLKGLVKRQLCPVNRRKMDINITEKGLRLLQELDEPLKKHLSEMKKKLTDKEAEQLSNLLDKMRG